VAFHLEVWVSGLGEAVGQIPQGVGEKRRGQGQLRSSSNVLSYLAPCSRTGFVTASKVGDRIAVLGLCIGVVGHVDDAQVHAVLWNRSGLRIPRSEIVWNENNRRWEASPDIWTFGCAEND
jgi:hypothetical protein